MNTWSRINRKFLEIMASLSGVGVACGDDPADKTADAPVDTKAYDGK